MSVTEKTASPPRTAGTPRPLQSMTGYGVETRDLPQAQLTLELRCVNGRFLDLSFRMADDLRALEAPMRERIAQVVQRGKLECRINLLYRQDAALPASLNPELLERLDQLARSVQARFPAAPGLTVAEILRWPGMLGELGTDTEALHQLALEALAAALEQFAASRAREGEKLKALLLDRVTTMRTLVAELRPRTPELVAAYRDKLRRRIEELLPQADAERVQQEVILFAQKIDVDEELDRLLAHLQEVERVLRAGGSVGKRLDFLMQELNREANTLGSKSAATEFNQTAVELKVLIEQMREQIQNLE